MTPDTYLRIAVAPALSLLPEKMDTPAARIMVVAICLQESRLMHRKQIRGPARSYAQFEYGGVVGVVTHKASGPHLAAALEALDLSDATVAELHIALEYNDILGALFTRLLLWTHAKPIAENAHDGWQQYYECWRPGKPHPETFGEQFEKARAAVYG